MNGGMYRPPSDRFGGNTSPLQAALTEGTQRAAYAAERQAAALEAILALLTAHLLAAAPVAFAPTPAKKRLPWADEDNELEFASHIRWVKYDTRSAELGNLRCAARHRAAAAKTPDEREAELETERKYSRLLSNRRVKLNAMRSKLHLHDGVLYRINWTAGTREVWQAAFLPY